MSLPKIYYSVPEVCEILQICPATFYKKLVSTGRIKLFKIGRRSFVTPDELDRLTKNNKDE